MSGLDSSRPDGARPRAGRAGKMVVGPGCARAAPLALAARDAPKASCAARGLRARGGLANLYTILQGGAAL